MYEVIRLTTADLAQFLDSNLPTLSHEWWGKHVIDRLSFQQQRLAIEKKFTRLDQLDLAALLRVLDQNWHELAPIAGFPREGRNWLKELQTVRNRWAHQSAEALAASDLYRDADTFVRVLNMLGMGGESVAIADAKKMEALAEIAAEKSDAIAAVKPTRENSEASDSEINDANITNEQSVRQTKFAVGDMVVLISNPADIMAVIEVVPGGKEPRYSVLHNNKITTYYESQLQLSGAGETAQVRLDIGELHAYLTSLQLLSPSTANLFSLRSGRINFIPYQYRPVLKLIRADRPRLLIADEVGVGKTIEAGLIIEELRARMDISSVLIICPKALVSARKWLVEMKRFDEQFTALDGPMLRNCINETHLDGEWPEQHGKAIVPFSLFDSDLVLGRNKKGRRKHQGLLDLDPPPKFDLVIVDEAHHIRNSETYLHQAVRYFCDNAHAAVFLTATPVQLGSHDLFTLLNVLRPDLIIDRASFDQMAEPNRPINIAVQHCRQAQKKWNEAARECLDEVAQTQWGKLFLIESTAFQRIYDQLGEQEISEASRIKLVRDLEELYTFSSIINRTRRRDIGEFTTRKPETLTIDFTPAQQQLHDELLEVVARILVVSHGPQNVKFMMTTIRRQAASCIYGLAPLLRDMLEGKLEYLEAMEIEGADTGLEIDLGAIDIMRDEIGSVIKKAENLDAQDPKVKAYVQVLHGKNQMPVNKALVFSTFRHTLAYLAKHTEQAGLRFGVIHGGVPDDDRAELRRRFALPRQDEHALDVLLSSEVGCEGLDFQFCDLIINYDLPWNPMRVEQRIGRIDRYGQKSETVAIVNIITPGTVDADIYERCLLRIGVFQHAIGGSEEILGEITREIQNIAENFELSNDERTNRLQQLGDNSIREIQEEHALEGKQAELFGLTVPNQSWREDIEAAETFWLSPASLQGCVAAYLTERLQFDGEYIRRDKPIKSLRLNQEARALLLEDLRQLGRKSDLVTRQWEKWLKGGDPLLSITFDQETAAAEPRVVHVNVLHPLVRQAARYLERPDAVYTSLTVETNEMPVGEYPFALYRWREEGVRVDERLVAVTSNSKLDDEILSLISVAKDAISKSNIDTATRNELDDKHHSKWSAARTNHVATNRDSLQHRAESLNVSHKARRQLLNDQIQRATDEKIRRMKESELSRADQDYERRAAELENAANRADILATPILFGNLNIKTLGAA